MESFMESIFFVSHAYSIFSSNKSSSNCNLVNTTSNSSSSASTGNNFVCLFNSSISLVASLIASSTFHHSVLKFIISEESSWYFSEVGSNNVNWYLNSSANKCIWFCCSL